MRTPPLQLTTEITGALRRAVGSIPESRLRQLMATPARRVVLDGVFWGLPRALSDTRAGEVVTAVRCHVTGRPDGAFDVYWLQYENGSWQAGRGPGNREPELTITVDSAELLHLGSGRSTLLQAYLSGRLRASGNPLIAARLTALLRGAASAQPVI